MIKTILGLILLLIPFLLVIKFKSKKIGFFYILSFLIAFHLVLAVLAQVFHVFSYNVVIGVNLFIAFVVLAKTNFKELFENIKKIKIDLVLIFVIVVLFIQLFFVHYNYTGKVTTMIEPYGEVENIKYNYPYFSDEWSAVSLIKYSISTGNLPLVNPLWYNTPFPNFELPFHSFASEIILLLDLNPLTQYSLLHIFSGILICVLVYFILRFNKVRKLPAAIASLCVLYIINGANLPGLWTFIPLIMGIISMLLSFLFMSLNKRGMILVTTFLALIFYPPLFVFCSLSLIFYLIFADISKKEKIKFIEIYFLIIVLVGLFISFFIYFFSNFTEFSSYTKLKIFYNDFFKGKIFYETFTQNAIPDFSIWKVIPIPVLFLSIFGIFKFFKKKLWLISPIFIGLVYWFFYSRVLFRFIIEYERVVLVTSILIVLLSGFGLNYLIGYLRKFELIRRYKILQISMILILFLFLISSFSYTKRDNWQELKLYPIESDRFFNPASPANNYLHEDDLRLFSGIKGKRFLSVPWKGTVVGVSTDNYPLETKPATITNAIFGYRDFMNADCETKVKIIQDYQIDYIYSLEFNCEGFELKGVSEEGFSLYKFK